MKTFRFFCITLLLAINSFCIFARSQKTETVVDYENEQAAYEYTNIVEHLRTVKEPFLEDNFIIFTQEIGPRHIGIAFDFEEYKTIHSFMMHTEKDFEGNVTNSLLFYILKRPEKITDITYRLIVDGLWTYDPVNPTQKYDEVSGIMLSYLDIGKPPLENTNINKNDFVKFIYRGDSGQQVHLGGTFTNWDPWIYELTETTPGCYELDLPLPAGKHYYNFYLGIQPIVDKTNPHRVYALDGHQASVIEIK